MLTPVLIERRVTMRTCKHLFGLAIALLLSSHEVARSAEAGGHFSVSLECEGE
jgi:hypothetical protein